MSADGSFVIAWQSYWQDGSDSSVYAQRYDASGQPLAGYNPDGQPTEGEFRVNTYTIGTQIGPSIAMDPSGRFVVTWHGLGQDGIHLGVFAQQYNASGQPVAGYNFDGQPAEGEFRVNTHTANNQEGYRSIAMAPDGRFVVAWRGHDGTDWGISAQRYDASGQPLAGYNLDGQRTDGEFRVNKHTPSIELNPSIAMAPDGSFVVAWQSYGQDGRDWGIYAQRYDAAGQPVGNEWVVNTSTVGAHQLPSIAVAHDGSFVIAWYGHGQDGRERGVYARRYDAAAPAVVESTHTSSRPERAAQLP
jgi:hypothetical protein